MSAPGVRLPRDWHSRPVQIAVAGCGGSGSHVLAGLARLHTCLVGLDHPGLAVVAYDPDRVTDSNVGRQLFAPADLGRLKADALIHRINLWYGLDWQAVPERLDADNATGKPVDLLVGCVDSAAARVALGAFCAARQVDFWLDLGNEQRTGQVVLGQPAEAAQSAGWRLPTVLEVFPDLRDPARRDPGPSCSLAESLSRQGPLINQMMATLALDALWQALRTGAIPRFAWFVNLDDGRVTSLPAEPAVTARYTGGAHTRLSDGSALVSSAATP